jgi:hypothetical protein
MPPDPSPAPARRAARTGAARLPLLPPALLALLGVVQIALAFGAGLSPWKGGGFGMFASTDHGGFREVRVLAETAEGEQRVPIPPEHQRAARRAREMPSAAALRALGRALAGEAPGAALRIEVRRLVFDPSDLRPVWRPLAQLRLEPAP